jgi:hypothetical protein
MCAGKRDGKRDNALFCTCIRTGDKLLDRRKQPINNSLNKVYQQHIPDPEQRDEFAFATIGNLL